ncbi:MAG: hypothetical protein IJW72_05185 [Alphaproteobacteria bacterium]|nr:hypothetical protein [Alphaproteobacteria bacterium]
MTAEANITTFYKLENGYTITRLDVRECNLIFRDKNHDIVAILNGCRGYITYINPYKGRSLNKQEKELLHRFIRSSSFRINNEVADFLDLSVIRYDDGQEEYISEKELKHKLSDRFSCYSLYVGKLRMHTLKISDYSQSGAFNISNAKIKKLIIGKHCDLSIDLRDNKHIEAVRIGENFNGGLNLSRSTIESVVIADNCRCDLTITENTHCFNLIVADIYSGNLNLRDCCFHNVKIGYYCYANITMAQNWGRRDIIIGDSFRGSLALDDVNVYSLKLGRDCKGKININGQVFERSGGGIYIDDDFAGTLDLQNTAGVERIEVGSHAQGRFNLLGNSGIKFAIFDKYFNGYADFSDSTVEYVRADYGSSGNFILNKCDKLILLELPLYKNSNIITEKKPIEVTSDSRSLYYRFLPHYLPSAYFSLFYHKIWHNLRGLFL